MALVVQFNVASLAAQRNPAVNQAQLGRSVERLSSGFTDYPWPMTRAGLGACLKPCGRRSVVSIRPIGTPVTASA